MEEILKNITETINGSPVKDLRFLSLDNVIVGLVKDEYWNSKIHNGYYSGKWTSKGRYIKEKNRPELNLKL
jgi:hypothetical protein